MLLKLGACGRVWVGMGIFRLMVMLMARAVSARRDYLILRYRVRGHSFFFFRFFIAFSGYHSFFW